MALSISQTRFSQTRFELVADPRPNADKRVMQLLAYRGDDELCFRAWVPFNESEAPPSVIETAPEVDVTLSIKLSPDPAETAEELAKAVEKLAEETKKLLSLPAAEEILLKEVDSSGIYSWIPFPTNEVPPRFVETALTIDGEVAKVWIDCANVSGCLTPLIAAKIISLDDMEMACKEKVFDQFIERIAQPLRWRQYISRPRLEKKRHVIPLLRFLHANLPGWKKQCQKEKRIYIPVTNPKGYSFECLSNGTIWLHHTKTHLNKMHSFVLNVETGQTYKLVSFDKKTGEKIRLFAPLFSKCSGILHFVEKALIRIKKKRSLPWVYEGKHLLYDFTLENYSYRFSLKNKMGIARQLLEGLIVLEKERIVHCGILPSTILCRLNQKKIKKDEKVKTVLKIKAVLSNFENAYYLEDLPEVLRVPYSFIPPECREPFDQLSHPFTIPIYQLGMCFKELFGQECAGIIDQMIHPDPSKRLSASDALAAFSPDHKESVFFFPENP